MLNQSPRQLQNAFFLESALGDGICATESISKGIAPVNSRFSAEALMRSAIAASGKMPIPRKQVFGRIPRVSQGQHRTIRLRHLPEKPRPDFVTFSCNTQSIPAQWNSFFLGICSCRILRHCPFCHRGNLRTADAERQRRDRASPFGSGAVGSDEEIWREKGRADV